MREIKFRAWIGGVMAYDPIYAQMQTVSASHPEFVEMREVLTLNKALSEAQKKGTVLMQFIGLLDKNGKEIYEGDVVRSDHETVVVSFDLGGEGEPADFVGAYMGWCFGDGETTGGGIGWGKEWEIIGNIYENPELLTKERRPEGRRVS